MNIKRTKVNKYHGFIPANNLLLIDNPSKAIFLVIGIIRVWKDVKV